MMLEPPTGNVYVLISNVGVQRRNAFISTLGSEGHQWDIVELICLFVSLSVCSFVHVDFYRPFTWPNKFKFTEVLYIIMFV